MWFSFDDRTNPHIDLLVDMAWKSSATHEGEYLRIPRREEDIDQLINDEEESEPELEAIETESPGQSPQPIDLSKFSSPGSSTHDNSSSVSPTTERLVIAVDTGIANLGEFVGGAVAFAVRGAAVCLTDKETIVLRYNTGPLLIDEENWTPVFRYIGKRLGREKLYLVENESGNLVPRPSAFETGNQLRDRCRNFVERMIQEEALGILSTNQRGLLLLDGALPAGTYDTPASFLEDMLNTAATNQIDVVAISKKSRISIAGKPINALFDDQPDFIGYAPLKDMITEERQKYADQGIVREASAITLANELFAVRFGLGPPSLTFRVDVNNSIRSTPDEVLHSVIDQCQIQGCYPRPLIEAHQFSSFTFQDIQTLTADLVARTGGRPKEDPSMEWMFSPFGALGK